MKAKELMCTTFVKLSEKTILIHEIRTQCNFLYAEALAL